MRKPPDRYSARRAAIGLGTSVVLVAATMTMAATAGLVRPAVARADEVTASQDNLRTGWDDHEPGLAPVSDGGPVGGTSFGQLFQTHVNGQVYAQPVVAGPTVVVATETNHVYGLNAVTGAVQWSDYLGAPEPASVLNCNDLTPDIGDTSTPVYDPSTGTVYLIAVVNPGSITAAPKVNVYALDAQTGAARPGWPVTIAGSPVNEPGVKFDPLTERQRTGLLLLGGTIYAGFGSYCDYLPYAGYITGVSTTSRHVSLWTDEAGLTDNQGGIWQGGGGLMSDGTGRIFAATGNGVSPAPGGGANPPPELGDSVVRLGVGANGELKAQDFFSPTNAPDLDAADRDFGSGGPMGLPFGTASLPHLLVQAGKDGRVFLLDRDKLGGRQPEGGTDAAVSMSGPFGGQWGHPAAFGPAPTVSAATSDDFVYYIGVHDQLRYLQFGLSGSTPQLADVASSSTTFGYGSGAPVVTSNGNDPASAVVWAVYTSGGSGTGATLQAFPAVPASSCTATAQCTISPIWTAPIGTASKFTAPATDGGRVYVGTRDGSVFGFGSPDAAPLTAAPVDFGRVSVGGRAGSATVTLTAASQVTVKGVTVPAPFKTGTARVNGAVVKFPSTLNPGATLAVPVTFTPGHAGSVTSALRVATNSANFPSVNVGLTGQGTAPGLYASAATVAFGRIAAHVTAGQSVMVVNGSTATVRVTAEARPAAPFGARLPAVGRALAAGQSLVIPLTFRPGGVATSTSAFTLTTTGGRKLTVWLTGTGKKAIGRLAAKAGSVAFGAVPLGTRTTRSIVLTNTGDLTATVTSVTGTAGSFGLQAAVPAGLPLVPGYTVTVPVTFTPSSSGPVASQFVLHWRDALGRHSVTVGLSGTGVAAAKGSAAVPAPGGGWTLNGSAAMSGQQLVLSGARNEAGSAIYPVPEAGNGLDVSFTALLSGAGGMTLSLFDASTARPSALGRAGSGFGAGGQPGIAITLGTHRYAGDPSGNFAAVAVSSARGLRILRSTAQIPALRGAVAGVRVTVSGGRVRVRVNGRQVLSVPLGRGVLPGRVLVGFTGGTGGAAGSQTVLTASARSAAGSLPSPGGGWSFNRAAQMSAGATRLTTTAVSTAGSVVYPAAVPTTGLKVTFTAQLAGGSGGNGLTFALLNPAATAATAVGGTGAALGFGGLSGVAVALDTTRTNKLGATEAAYICTSSAGSPALTSVQTAFAIPPLRAGPDVVTVQVSTSQAGPLMSVWLDGELVVRTAVPTLTPTALPAFTGATGDRTDLHVVRDIAISTAS